MMYLWQCRPHERIVSISESTSTTEDERTRVETSKLVSSNENDGSIVKERVRLEKRSTTTRTPKRRRATLIRFACVRGRENFARAQLLLCNISNRSFRYKIKGEVNANISALPSSRGYLSARGSARLVLTWHRPEGFEKKRIQTKLILYTYFIDSQSGHLDKRTATRLVGRPIKDGHSKISYDRVIDEILDWLCSQSHDTIVLIIFCGIVIYSMGVADSSKYERFY
uniref:Fibronectin type-III domain-containing protein n=1 Tax=Ascaris lumbricoides TaxID=6252 RepID=A0A0M3I7P9_ASCLU